ncbi:HET-domain-containing protein, partial [Parathielavia appendiculata]
MVWFPYATLSHRWGPSTAACRTTTTNGLDRKNKGIKVSELCQTFQDAIMVALEMGMPYLWIDSLCIIQDDDKDWRVQSAFMDDIYMNSLLTIMAHSYAGEDGGSGFLASAFASEGADPVSIYNSPLSRRSWILQERLLSPRILHFFPSQLYYESRYFGIVRAEDHTPAFRDPDQLREAILRPENQKPGATPLDWFRVVERYSACELTQPWDKLVAISGIAKHVQQGSGGVRYLAGLWSDRAAKGLLWLRRGPVLKRDPAWAGRAPSWSWASVDGPVRY